MKRRDDDDGKAGGRMRQQGRHAHIAAHACCHLPGGPSIYA